MLLHDALDDGLANIRKWYQKADETDAYILSLVLNPTFKLEYIKASWDQHYVQLAIKVVKDAVSN